MFTNTEIYHRYSIWVIDNSLWCSWLLCAQDGKLNKRMKTKSCWFAGRHWRGKKEAHIHTVWLYPVLLSCNSNIKYSRKHFQVLPLSSTVRYSFCVVTSSLQLNQSDEYVYLLIFSLNLHSSGQMATCSSWQVNAADQRWVSQQHHEKWTGSVEQWENH